MSKNGFLISLLCVGGDSDIGPGRLQHPEHAARADLRDGHPGRSLLSRCVRCHGAGGTLNADPTATLGFYRLPYRRVLRPHGGRLPRRHRRSTAMGWVTTRRDPGRHDACTNYIHGRSGAAYPMPPAPAPRLTSDQLDIFDLWLANGAPRRLARLLRVAAPAQASASSLVRRASPGCIRHPARALRPRG